MSTESIKEYVIKTRYNRRKTTDRALKRIIAPYVQVVRKSVKSEEKAIISRLISHYKVFLSDDIDLPSLLYKTANIFKVCTNSSGVLLYLVDKEKGEIYLKPQHAKDVERNKVNWKICEGKTAAAHVASTKQHVVIDNSETDERFSEGLGWPDAKTALCIPIVQPDDSCFAVLELYRTNNEPYDDASQQSTLCCMAWVGAAIHQANNRIAQEQQMHINRELLSLLRQYFCEKFGLDAMVYEIIAICKRCLNANRGSFFIIQRENIEENMMSDMYDEGWENAPGTITKKKMKICLSDISFPPSYAAQTGKSINIKDVYTDKRFRKEVDPVSGALVRSQLCIPLIDKSGVIGIISVMNKINTDYFTPEDEDALNIIADFCTLMVQFCNMQYRMDFSKNLNSVCDDILSFHMKPCAHSLGALLESHVSMLPAGFDEFDWYCGQNFKEMAPNLLFYMINKLSATQPYDRSALADFILTVLLSYRDNPYHNAEHAFAFTHCMYNILIRNMATFSKIEAMALMLGGFCHDIDHPGVNNNYLVQCKHPLSVMYYDSILENHHFYVARKVILAKGILNQLPHMQQVIVLDEIKYNILATDLAVHFRIRAKLAVIVNDGSFDWKSNNHKKIIKATMMTACDLSGQSKPFHIVKKLTESVYEEFYRQGDLEREMGYVPLSMMDRNKKSNQPSEQIQFLQVVVLPCLLFLQNILLDIKQLTDLCLNAKESWQEVHRLKGKKAWMPKLSLVNR